MVCFIYKVTEFRMIEILFVYFLNELSKPLGYILGSVDKWLGFYMKKIV